MFKSLAGAAAAVVAMAVSAHASPVTSFTLKNTTVIGSSYDLAFNGNVETVDVPGLTAKATMTFDGFTNGGKTATFLVDLANTSTIAGSRVSAFGFDTDPNVGSAIARGVFTRVRSGAFPNQFGDIDLCATNGNTCQGGGGTGVTKGNVGQFTLALTFADVVASVTFDNFGVRYQSIEGVTLGTSGTGRAWIPPCTDGCGDDSVPVPEPASLLLMGAGMLLGASRLRRLR